MLAKKGHITAFIDPAIYYAHPEIELAFTTLFNTFGSVFYERYNELRPIKSGFFEVRRDIFTTSIPCWFMSGFSALPTLVR